MKRWGGRPPTGEEVSQMRDQFSVEVAGALTPELEGAAHSRAHDSRTARPDGKKEERGEKPSGKSNSPSGPRRP